MLLTYMHELHSGDRVTRWPNGRFIEGRRDPAQGRHSVRRRLLEVLAEETVAELDGQPATMSRAEAVARAVVARAEKGYLPAAELILEQTEEPIGKGAEQGDWHVTVQYVHQQLNVTNAAGLELPPPTD